MDSWNDTTIQRMERYAKFMDVRALDALVGMMKVVDIGSGTRSSV